MTNIYIDTQLSLSDTDNDEIKSPEIVTLPYSIVHDFLHKIPVKMSSSYSQLLQIPFSLTYITITLCKNEILTLKNTFGLVLTHLEQHDNILSKLEIPVLSVDNEGFKNSKYTQFVSGICTAYDLKSLLRDVIDKLDEALFLNKPITMTSV